MDRRIFITRLVRGGVLASMAMLAGVLLSRRQVSLRQECGLDVVPGCANFLLCELPPQGPEASEVVEMASPHRQIIEALLSQAWARARHALAKHIRAQRIVLKKMPRAAMKNNR